MSEMMISFDPIPLEDIQAARDRLSGAIVRTPLVRLNVSDAPGEIFLKLENLQPIGSFKIRGAGNRMRMADEAELENGVWTASAGNMAQGVAWFARLLGVDCTVVAPETAPLTKLDAIRRLGARLITVPFQDWLEIYHTRSYPGVEGLFIHAFSDPAVMSGNGTIGLELLEDLPNVDTVLIPYGGGGLSCGIASTLRALKPEVKVYACEVETAAPLAASFATGEPTQVPHTPSFVDGIGAPLVYPEMWDLASRLLDGSLVVSVAQAADALRLLVQQNHIVAEGAGAVPIAAALAGLAGNGVIACVVSGGNIDTAKLVKILGGEIP